MFKWSDIFDLMVEILRALLTEALLSRVRQLPFMNSTKGMKGVRRRIQHKVRRQLFNRMSTGRKR